VKKVVFTRQARREFRAAARWYEQGQEGLGIEFLHEIDAALERIMNKPTASPLWRADRKYRKGGVRRFPYIIFFMETEKRIRVVAVAHKRRRPGYWIARDDE
jgi:plasmid stabilization system protein ParE